MAHRLPALHIFLSLWNQAMNHKKMDPERVEVLRKEAVQHLHFDVGLYKLQLEGGRQQLAGHIDGKANAAQRRGHGSL